VTAVLGLEFAHFGVRLWIEPRPGWDIRGEMTTTSDKAAGNVLGRCSF